MLKKVWTNLCGGRNFLLTLICMALLSAVGAVSYPPLAGAQGVDSYTKLMLHADGSDQGTSFTDSSTTPKTVTNTESYDSYTKLMLHMEGSGNSFVDSAASKAVTTNGDVSQTTAQFKFSSKSGVFDGTGDYLSLADSDDWNFGSGDFTIDCWVRFNGNSGSQVMIGHGGLHGISSVNGWEISYGWAANRFIFYDFNGSANLYLETTSWIPSLNTWYHIAVVRNGNTVTAYVDGTSIVSQTFTGSITNSTYALRIGSGYDGIYFLNGYLDEVRISKGIARWTSNFTPPILSLWECIYRYRN